MRGLRGDGCCAGNRGETRCGAAPALVMAGRAGRLRSESTTSKGRKSG